MMKSTNTLVMFSLFVFVCIFGASFLAGCTPLQPILAPVAEAGESDIIVSNSSPISSVISIDTIRLYTTTEALVADLAELETEQQVLMAYTGEDLDTQTIGTPRLYYQSTTASDSEQAGLALLNVTTDTVTNFGASGAPIVLEAKACDSLSSNDDCLTIDDASTLAYWVTDEDDATGAQTALFLYPGTAGDEVDCKKNPSWYCDFVASATKDEVLYNGYDLYHTTSQIQVDIATDVWSSPLSDASFLPAQEVETYLANLPDNNRLLFALIYQKGEQEQSSINLQYTPYFTSSISSVDKTAWINFGSSSRSNEGYSVTPFNLTSKECTFASSIWGCGISENEIDAVIYVVETEEGINAIHSCPNCVTSDMVMSGEDWDIIDWLCERFPDLCGGGPEIDVLPPGEISVFDPPFRDEPIYDYDEIDEPLLDDQ